MLTIHYAFIILYREDQASARRRPRLPRSASTHLLSRKPTTKSGLQGADVEDIMYEWKHGALEAHVHFYSLLLLTNFDAFIS